MYRRPKFLEVLLQIRQEMSREADYDVDLFAEKVRSGTFSTETPNRFDLNAENKTAKKTRIKKQNPDSRKTKD